MGSSVIHLSTAHANQDNIFQTRNAQDIALDIPALSPLPQDQIDSEIYRYHGLQAAEGLEAVSYTHLTLPTTSRV